jgi:cell division protein FtsA
VTLSNDNGLAGRTINLGHLCRIMSVRLEEVFQLIRDEVQKAGLLDHLRAGVFLCGGGARIPRIQELAGRVFGLPVAVGRAAAVSGLRSALDQPEFAAAIGLVTYGAMQLRKRGTRSGLTGGLRHKVSQLFRVAKK